jgi:hypothetical protein
LSPRKNPQIATTSQTVGPSFTGNWWGSILAIGRFDYATLSRLQAEVVVVVVGRKENIWKRAREGERIKRGKGRE